MANPVKSDRGFQFIQPAEVRSAKTAYAAAKGAYEAKMQRVDEAGEYAKMLAPVLLTHVIAIAVLNYFRVFTLLGFFNSKVTTYAVPAAASYAAGAFADKIRPVMNGVGSVAGFAARQATQLATVSSYDRYIAG